MYIAQASWAGILFLPFATAISLWAIWSDLARMKIPNKAVIALVVTFAVIGLVVLPLEDYLWRWTHLLVVLVVGFVLSMAGAMGAGDAKFLAAMAPFVALPDASLVATILVACLIVGFALHRIARSIPQLRAAAPDWESWERRDFPMGLILGSSLIIYLVLAAIYGS